MGTRLSKAPVFFTLAQMRFNPMLAMEPLLAGLQEAFRLAGFPDYVRTEVRTLEVSTAPDGVQLGEKTITRLMYRNKAETAAILLDPGALTFELTDYPDFGEFSGTFLKALEIVHQHRRIEYCDRLGMRMLDAVQPDEGSSLEQYLVPQAMGLGFLAPEGLEHQQTLTESLFEQGPRALLVRAVRVPSGLAAPPDLAPFRLKLRQRFVDFRGETVMLDCDSSNSSRSDYSPEAAMSELAELKAALSRSFKALVTPYAMEKWA
jgi:uncharacterized protein (TIGR04255 family)